jgi:hypothetical protein
LLKEKNKNITYILDSNIGNICIPEKRNNGKGYFCKCRIKNNNKELSLDNYITASDEIEKLEIDSQEIIKKTSIKNEGNLIKINIKFNETVSYVDFIFIFNKNKIVNILSTFYKNKSPISPQIYSSEMFYLKNKTIYFNFNLKPKFSLISSYIDGDGEIEYNNITFQANINFQGKPLLFLINEEIKSISFTPKKTNENIDKKLFFFIKLNYIIQNNDEKEINHDKTLREIVEIKNLPIYYYLKCEEGNSDELMNINFQIINFNNEQINFEIFGYLVNDINEQVNESNEYIHGSYDMQFKVGILNINKCSTKYILVAIYSTSYVLDDKILIEILAMSKIDKRYSLLPINKYITDINNSNENKEYLIKINKKYLNDKNILVEFIPNCKEMKLESDANLNLEKDINSGMVQKYRGIGLNDSITLKVKTPQNISNCYYLLRYYYSSKKEEIKYKFNERYNIKKGKNQNDIIIDFNGIEIINNKDKIETNFKIYGLLYKYEKDIKNEFMNSSSKNEITRAQTKLKKDNDFNFSLSFRDIKTYHDDDFKYYLQIKIDSREIKNFFNEEYLIYTLQIDLSDVLEHKHIYLHIIFISISIIIIIMIIFITIMIKMKKKNANLEEKVLAISFQKGNIDENIFDKSEKSKNDEDYENTFI